MTVRKDYQKGLRSDGEFFSPEPTKPVVVVYTMENMKNAVDNLVHMILSGDLSAADWECLEGRIDRDKVDTSDPETLFRLAGAATILQWFSKINEDLWLRDFSGFTEELFSFIEALDKENRTYRVFGFWPGKKRSDVFPLGIDEVRSRCLGTQTTQ
jgi:hypothetical protein